MNWTKILHDAGIPEPPGRDQAYEDAVAMTAAQVRARWAQAGKRL
jgi:hypothetical protein